MGSFDHVLVWTHTLIALVGFGTTGKNFLVMIARIVLPVNGQGILGEDSSPRGRGT